MVHGYIEEATKRGMYAIVDWHQLTPGDPNYNLARAKTFFTEIAQRHKDKTNIIYDIANEPNGVSWAKVKTLRRADDPGDPGTGPGRRGARRHPRLGDRSGVSDGRNEQDVINNPVNATNFMYTFHFYAASHKDAYLNALSRAADQIPIFVTEFGTQTYTGDGGNDFATSQSTWTSWRPRRSAGPTGTSPTTSARAPCSRAVPARATTSAVPVCSSRPVPGFASAFVRRTTSQ